MDQLSYDEWVRYVFDHEVTERAWYWDWDLYGEYWNETENPVQTVEYLTRAFETIDVIAQSYTDEQMNQALWFLASNACSSHMFAPLDEKVTWATQEQFLHSIFALNQKLFLPKCSPHLGYLLREYPPDMNPLNSICYMWWDIIPFGGNPNEPTRAKWDDTVIEVMRLTLQLESDACREGALHGLGHWQLHYRDKTQAIIDQFLRDYPNLKPDLLNYARYARTGCVL